MQRHLQLWSYNYDPEPTGIAPVSTSLAQELQRRGWSVEVVAAHPHYPEPRWGNSVRPYREVRNGIPVVRLPLWVGRGSAGARMRQEASFTAALTAAIPFLGRPDLLLVASPSFPAVSAAMINAGVRRIPWALWIHDLLPDGAVAAGLLEEGSLPLRASRKLEAAAYRSCDQIVVLSGAFRDNLLERGIPAGKVRLIYDPATRGIPDPRPQRDPSEPPRLLSMGNIGHTQGLAPLVAAFERSEDMERLGAKLTITGNGVAAPDVRQEVRSERVLMAGLVADDALESELRSATYALVSQSYEGTEFNLPSKLMNFMAYGLPVIAAVNPNGEVARIVRESGGGWVSDSSDPDSFPQAVADASANPAESQERALAARRYAEQHFSLEAFGDRFDELLGNLMPVRAQAADSRADSRSKIQS